MGAATGAGLEGTGRKGEADLFEIPPADLMQEQDDLFGVDGSRGDTDAIHERRAAAPEDPAQDAATPEFPSSPTRRRGGFLGWVARIFGGAS